ncbi:TolC family protein [Filimonas effusa]|uniref:TolC family protein n=1 Tax=Filimonas effusa TaxID=2508721 RepID=A0A4Q1D979_9BACT|nr:TolC family protein [Filimonas effusa]RXK85881.1 TolC family protein [Filimonas effusa]
MKRLYPAWGVAALVSILLLQSKAHAQVSSYTDTLRLSLPDAEKRFIDSNLQLLAAHYDVDAQKALIKQAGLWDNPVLSTDHMITADNKWFPYGKTTSDGAPLSQYAIQLEQLIYTAGKRGKQINMAVTNGRISELQLQDLLRNLRYQLHAGYYMVAKQIAYRQIYQEQLAQLQKLSSGMKTQLEAGNIARKDYLRIQALVLSLQQDMAELDRDIADTQTDLRVLLQVKDGSFILPATNATALFAGVNASMPEQIDAVIASGEQNNPYYQLQQAQVLYQQQNLAYQKALRVPDVTVQTNFDKNSNVAINYWGVGFSVPLPLFNRNQGNIKSAEATIKQQQALTQDAATSLRQDIRNAYQKLAIALQQHNSSREQFYEDYRGMQENMVKSYALKQVGLPEFIDFFTDFTTSQQRLIAQQLNLALAKEQLNYAVGTDVVK